MSHFFTYFATLAESTLILLLWYLRPHHQEGFNAAKMLESVWLSLPAHLVRNICGNKNVLML